MENDLYFEYRWNLNQIIYDIKIYLNILRKHEKEIETDKIDWEDWDINSIIYEFEEIVEDLCYLEECL